MLFDRAAVIGVGLIGGSLAVAARRRGLIREVVGVGRSEANLETARRRGLVDSTTSDIASIGAVDLVVLAIPVRSCAAVVRRMAAQLVPGTIVTDAGSTKQSVVEEVEDALPDGCVFVGAHPIAGSEQAGAAAAREDLFDDRVCVVTPTDATPRAAVDAITGLWRGVGARVREMTPSDHDRALAWTSHLGHVLSYALARSLGDVARRGAAGKEGNLFDFAGPSLHDITRLAGGSVAMWRDIFLANNVAIAAGIDGFSEALLDLRDAIERGDEEKLEALLEIGLATRERIGSGE